MGAIAPQRVAPIGVERGTAVIWLEAAADQTQEAVISGG